MFPSLILFRMPALLLVLFSGFVAISYPQNNRGTLVGTVADRNDARVTDVKIVVVGKRGTFELTSDQFGQFAISLPPGTYTAAFSKKGFKRTLKRNIIVRSNEQRNVTVCLEIIIAGDQG